MTWTKLDENFSHHPKIIAAGERAELIHIHALIYCNRFLTDGFVPAPAVPTFTRIKSWVEPSIEALVKLGIWVPVEGGYQIHHFLEYQPSRAQVIAERKQKASAGQAGGLARAKHLLKQNPSTALAEGQAKSKPVPVSVPEPLNASSVGSNDPGIELAVAIADVLGVAALSPLEIQACEQALVEFPYLIHAEFVERAKEHQTVCKAKNYPLARSVQGLWEAWRSQNDYNADHGRTKPRGKSSSGFTKAFA